MSDYFARLVQRAQAAAPVEVALSTIQATPPAAALHDPFETVGEPELYDWPSTPPAAPRAADPRSPAAPAESRSAVAPAAPTGLAPPTQVERHERIVRVMDEIWREAGPAAAPPPEPPAAAEATSAVSPAVDPSPLSIADLFMRDLTPPLTAEARPGAPGEPTPRAGPLSGPPPFAPSLEWEQPGPAPAPPPAETVVRAAPPPLAAFAPLEPPPREPDSPRLSIGRLTVNVAADSPPLAHEATVTRIVRAPAGRADGARRARPRFGLAQS